VRGYFELGRPELNACHRLLEREKKAIEQVDPNVEGFNVGTNDGKVAGQTIFHCHMHLIPRRKGGMEDSTSGVRRSSRAKASTDAKIISNQSNRS
jgi:diadenosine tetraphosphate (Ap4A) HIT family hydrolase